MIGLSIKDWELSISSVIQELTGEAPEGGWEKAWDRSSPDSGAAIRTTMPIGI